MLTITDEIVDNILDLAEEYANARVGFVASPLGVEHAKARGHKLQRFEALRNYLEEIRKAQQCGSDATPQARPPYPNDRRHHCCTKATSK